MPGGGGNLPGGGPINPGGQKGISPGGGGSFPTPPILPIIIKPTPPVAMPIGGGSIGIARAAAMPGVASNQAIPPLTYAVGGCNSMGGSCVINPLNPSVYMQASPPAGDLFYVVPVLSYSNANFPALTEVGAGWTHTFRRQVLLSGNNPTVVTGSGQQYAYTGVRGGGGFATPNSPAVNSLQSTSGFSSFTETQPDGTLFQYAAPSSGVSSLVYMQNPSGARWTVTYDSNGRVSFITDPVTRRTTLSYDATSGKLNCIQDPFGRRTSITIDSAGDLVQVVSPELCVTSMAYDANHELTAWVNPLGDRTSLSLFTANATVTSPLGAVTTISNLSLLGGAFRPANPGHHTVPRHESPRPRR